jgi:hypothetical protein
MCLNYEHNRNRKLKGMDTMTKDILERKKVESHIKNIKLKFSRKLTGAIQIVAKRLILSQQPFVRLI